MDVHVDSSDEELQAQMAKEQDDAESLSESGDEEDSGEEMGELSDFKGNTEEVKLVLVVRTDLGMSKGTVSAAMRSYYFECSQQLWVDSICFK